MVVVGLVLLIVACWIFATPPTRSTVESAKGENKTTTAESDPTTVVVSLGTAGVVFLLLAFNGFKFPKFEALGLKVDMPDLGAQDAPTVKMPDATRAESSSPPTSAPTSAPLGRGFQVIANQKVPDTLHPMIIYGKDSTETFLMRVSWNGLRILRACQWSAKNGKPIKLREVAKAGQEMNYDYAFGLFIAAFSANVFHGLGDPTTGVAQVHWIDPTVDERLADVMQGNINLSTEFRTVREIDRAQLEAYLARQ